MKHKTLRNNSIFFSSIPQELTRAFFFSKGKLKRPLARTFFLYTRRNLLLLHSVKVFVRVFKKKKNRPPCPCHTVAFFFFFFVIVDSDDFIRSLRLYWKSQQHHCGISSDDKEKKAASRVNCRPSEER